MSRLQQQLSALLDGELADEEAGAVMAALGRAGPRAHWQTYQAIGEVLRNTAAAQELSPGFSARLARRLEQEANRNQGDSAAVPA
jgi:sigma-E factor negative regulatory protein RseA